MENVIIYVLITTKHGRVKDVATKMLSCPQVENVHELIGQYDIIVKVNLKDMKEIETFLRTCIRPNFDIERTETLVVSDIPSRGMK